MSTVMPTIPQRELRQFHWVAGVLLLAFAVQFAYGVLQEVSWRVVLRQNGDETFARVVGYRDGAPVVLYRTLLQETVEVGTQDHFTAWNAPPIGSKVRIYYSRKDPNVVHVAPNSGLSSFEWLFAPAGLALLLVFMLWYGIRFLLFSRP